MAVIKAGVMPKQLRNMFLYRFVAKLEKISQRGSF